MSYLASPYLAHALQSGGLIEIGTRAAQDAILEVYDIATSKQSASRTSAQASNNFGETGRNDDRGFPIRSQIISPMPPSVRKGTECPQLLPIAGPPLSPLPPPLTDAPKREAESKGKTKKESRKMERCEHAALPVPGSSDSSDDSSSTSEPSEDEGSDGNAYSQPKPMSRESLNLAVQFLGRPENKRSGPEDPRYTTDEYV